MKALLTTNHLREIKGSEITLLEVAEYLLEKGWLVDVYTNLLLPPMLDEFLRLPHQERLRLAYEPYDNDFADDYDFVWIQHSLLPDEFINKMAQEGTNAYIAWVHLSVTIHIEMPLLVDIENSIADKVLLVSEEVAKLADEFGLNASRRTYWRNPAPRRFITNGNESLGAKSFPENILIVSNHPPQEVVEAADILRKRNINIIELGDRVGAQRLHPDDLSGVDGVITIGKTVQYALGCRVPVYNYDHFAGVGWLDSDKIIDREKRMNFSGRSTPKKRSPLQLADDIESGWKKAAMYTYSAKYRADFMLDDVWENLSVDVTDSSRKTKYLTQYQAMRWKAFNELHRGLYRTLEYYRDEMSKLSGSLD